MARQDEVNDAHLYGCSTASHTIKNFGITIRASAPVEPYETHAQEKGGWQAIGNYQSEFTAPMDVANLERRSVNPIKRQQGDSRL